jgi:hypothetical protein
MESTVLSNFVDNQWFKNPIIGEPSHVLWSKLLFKIRGITFSPASMEFALEFFISEFS